MVSSRYKDFICRNENRKILYLELGGNTLIIIKYPFWKMTAKNPNATYAYINSEEASRPVKIEKRPICIESNIGHVMDSLIVN